MGNSKNDLLSVKNSERKKGGGARRAYGAAAVAECGLFAALMTVSAYIRIPFPFVPLTFQTAVCILCGLLLGAKKGAISMCAYALAGLVGLPVFTSGGGLSYVLMPSFGYIIGFIAAAAVAGLVVSRADRPSFRRCLAAAFAALAVNYAVGTAYFIAVWQLSGYEGLLAAVVEYNLLYIPKDALLSLTAAGIARQALPAIARLRGARRGNRRKS